MSTLTQQVVEGSFWGAFANFASRIGTFIFTILLARFLFPENFGLYSLTMSIALVFMTFADLGLDRTLIRYFSSTKSKNKAANYFQYIFKLKFLVSFLVSFALLLAAYPISFWIYKKPQLFLPLIMASLFILTSLFVSFFSSFFYAIKKFKYVGKKEVLLQTIRILVTVLVFIFLTSVYHIFGVFAGLILTNLIILLLLIFWINKFTPHVFKKPKTKIDKTRIIKFVGFIIIATTSGIIFASIDTIMLGFFVSLAFIGYYKIAFALIFGIISLFSYLSSVLLPIFTGIENKNLERAFNKVMRFIFIFLVPSSFGILALGNYFIKLLYGQAYLFSDAPLKILSFLLLFWIPSAVIGTLFYSKEKPKYIAKAVLLSLILNIILNYILISQLLKISELWAIKGAAIATLTSFGFLFFYNLRNLKKKFNIRFKKTIFIKPIFASLIMFLVITIAKSLFKMTFLAGIIVIFFGILIYFSVLSLIRGFVREDIAILKKIPILRYLSKQSNNHIKT